jgi:hypothetical protein
MRELLFMPFMGMPGLAQPPVGAFGAPASVI